MKRILIISDGKAGHLNQSIAFCKIKKISYDILEVKFKSKLHKIFSYFLDKFSFYTDTLFDEHKKINPEFYDAIVSTGSSTYYFNKLLSKKYKIKSVVLMYPNGYKTKDFDYVVVQKHDNFVNAKNVIISPVNISYVKAKNYIKKDEEQKALAFIIGGENKIFEMDSSLIRDKLDYVFENYPEHLKYITTSRRTPFDIESLIDEYDFDYKLIYSREPEINPIGDFIKCCDLFFITMDSTSMISEVRANSNALIEIIELKSKKQDTKYHRLVENVKNIDKKIDFDELLKEVKI